MKTYQELNLHQKIMVKGWIQDGTDDFHRQCYCTMAMFGSRYAISLYLIKLKQLKKRYKL